MSSWISFVDGQTSRKKTGLPSLPVPRGSLYRSSFMLPAMAYATTSGGDAKKFILTCGWMRPSKLRLPESTEQATTSLFCSAVAISSGNGPELPMHVVQP